MLPNIIGLITPQFMAPISKLVGGFVGYVLGTIVAPWVASFGLPVDLFSPEVQEYITNLVVQALFMAIGIYKAPKNT